MSNEELKKPLPEKGPGSAEAAWREETRRGLHLCQEGSLSNWEMGKIKRYRRALEDATAKLYGPQITASQATAINSAMEHQRLIYANRRRHARYREQMSFDDEMASDKQLADLLKARDRAVASLQLGNELPGVELHTYLESKEKLNKDDE